MNDSSDQIYGGETVRGYTNFGQQCDLNVYDWARSKLFGENVNGKIVIDAGCGNGQQTFSHLLHEGALKLYGVEASQEMIDAISADIRNDKRLEIMIGDLGTLLPAMKELQADFIVNLFNILCFRHPRLPIQSMHHPLRAGGSLIAVSNAFAPADISLDPTEPDRSVDIDLHEVGASQENVVEGTMFRQVLRLEKPVPLQDHVHTIRDFSAALPDDQWKVVEARLFPPQGCTLVDPEDAGAEFAGLHTQAGFEEYPLVFSQRTHERLQYVKLCLVAEKKV